MRLIFLVVSLACVAAGLLFGALNPQPARIDLYWHAFEGSLGLLLLCALLAGAFAGGLAVLAGMVWPLQRRLQQARRANARAAGPRVPDPALPPPDAEYP